MPEVHFLALIKTKVKDTSFLGELIIARIEFLNYALKDHKFK